MFSDSIRNRFRLEGIVYVQNLNDKSGLCYNLIQISLVHYGFIEIYGGKIMSVKENLCRELKKYDDVIIYGYEDIGMCVLNYIIDLETSIKIANYSGKVKYFATSDQKRDSNRVEKKGIKIRSIYDLTEYAKSGLVIIATQEIHHKDIDTHLDELGFENRIYIAHEDYCILRECVENHKTIIDNNIQQYHLNHQVKLNRLRKKVERGKKIKVFFMTHDAAVFGCASVYWSMLKDELFEPYIYVVSRRDIAYKAFSDDVLKDIAFFENRGYRVISGYDEFWNPKDLHTLNPDILFYDIPKLYGAAGGFYNRMDQLNWEYLTCYVPYSLLMVDSFYYHYHTKCIRETWRFFLDTNASFRRVLADGDFCAFNTVLSGYPKLDDYYNKEENNLPQKIQNNKRTVIYAPHHSLGVSNNFATFDLYKDDILRFAKEHPEINFVFKPHPLLPFRLRESYKRGIVDFLYQDYVDEWESMENGVCVTQGDYIGIFKKSDVMITDCGSFIGEYFPSKKPCIYLFNPRKLKQDEVYTPLASKILNTYYVTRTREELFDNIENVIIQGNDTKRKEREELFDAEFSNIGHSGQYICEYLKQQFID